MKAKKKNVTYIKNNKISQIFAKIQLNFLILINQDPQYAPSNSGGLL